MSGKPLDSEMVRVARQEEMDVYKQHGVYEKVPISECVRVTGRQPIGSRWVDINKGDVAAPEYRSRFVACEIKRDERAEMFATTPPLEAKRHCSA